MVIKIQVSISMFGVVGAVLAQCLDGYMLTSLSIRMFALVAAQCAAARNWNVVELFHASLWSQTIAEERRRAQEKFLKVAHPNFAIFFMVGTWHQCQSAQQGYCAKGC